MKKLLLVTLLAGVLPLAAQAESTVTTSTTAAAPVPATARLEFKITVPKVLYLQVGAGTPVTTVGTINEIEFAVPAAGVGNGTPVAGIGGDLAGGGVTVRVLSNSGTSVNLTSTTTGPLTAGGAVTVPWSDIAVTAAALPTTTAGYTNAAIAHPAFVTGASGGTSTPTNLTGTGGLVRREGSWTFAYANTAALPAGTYGDTVANNARVTYTATAVP